MKDIVVYLPLFPYLRQWLTSNLGSPVRFPARSYESTLLTRLCSRRPAGVEESASLPSGCVAIVLPDNAHHRPEYYNYLSRSDRSKMAHAIEELFRLHLWNECAHLCSCSGRLNAGLNDWCQKNGIGVIYREAVRQKFYRLRALYDGTGIVLGQKYRKKTATTPYKNGQHNEQ